MSPAARELTFATCAFRVSSCDAGMSPACETQLTLMSAAAVVPVGAVAEAVRRPRAELAFGWCGSRTAGPTVPDRTASPVPDRAAASTRPSHFEMSASGSNRSSGRRSCSHAHCSHAAGRTACLCAGALNPSHVHGWMQVADARLEETVTPDACLRRQVTTVGVGGAPNAASGLAQKRSAASQSMAE
eukprot:6186577-Pleurochrysis_carterae.AAC.1